MRRDYNEGCFDVNLASLFGIFGSFFLISLRVQSINPIVHLPITDLIREDSTANTMNSLSTGFGSPAKRFQNGLGYFFLDKWGCLWVLLPKHPF